MRSIGVVEYGTWTMFTSRRIAVSVVVTAIILGVGLVVAFQVPGEGSDVRIVQPGAPGQSGRALSADQLRSLPPPRHNAADTLFFQRMIQHHAQALEMTALVSDRTTSADLSLLAGRIEVSQRDEIEQMEGWLRQRGLEIPQPHTNHAGHDTLMPGMLNDEQLKQLERARGAEFDRLFLQFMIHHHEGALVMVRELYAAGGGLESAGDRFAREVNADQDIEISRMREMLAKRTG
jgi:uncharacterized protein (DUF305 family)